MTRILWVALLALAITALSTRALAQMPQQGVWVTPADAKPNDKITINAFVYNPERQDVTATIVFADEGGTLGSVVLVVPKEAAKIAMTSWTMPTKQSTITARVTKAIGATDKKEITTLEGVLGTAMIGPKTKTLLPEISFKDTSYEGVAGGIWSRLEAMRMHYAEMFATKRDAARVRLGMDKPADLLDRFDYEETGKPTTKVEVNAGDYVTLIYATSLASLFGSMVLFYIAAVLLLIFIIKFIFGRFV